MSACMSGTRGSGVLSSTGDVFVIGVGGVCDMCMCLARGGVGGEGCEWMRELGLGFTNPVETGGVLDMCLCFGCGGVGWGRGGGWCYICVRCESGFNGRSFSSSKQFAARFYQQFNTSKLGRHTSSGETRLVTRETKRKPLEE